MVAVAPPTYYSSFYTVLCCKCATVSVLEVIPGSIFYIYGLLVLNFSEHIPKELQKIQITDSWKMRSLSPTINSAWIMTLPFGIFSCYCQPHEMCSSTTLICRFYVPL